MTAINDILSFLNTIFQWWCIVLPWEQAVFVRKGKKSKLLGPGIYFKIPFIDIVFVQTTRMRMVEVPIQALSTKCGKTITIRSAISYSISDIEKLYNTIYHPEMTITTMVMSLISDFINSRDISDVTTASIEEEVSIRMNQTNYGLKEISVSITNFAVVRTYRLIQDSSFNYEGLDLDKKK